MTDRELLELAAKAAGITYDGEDEGGHAMWFVPELSRYCYWNPLTDDGDAMRMAVKLRLEVVHLEGGGTDVIRWVNGLESVHVCESGADPYAATRRAIVRAAAELGRAMK